MIVATTRRRLAILVSAALVGVAAVGSSAGSSLAGARLIFFGSPGHDGTLILSPVQSGALTAFRMLTENNSGQTVNHASVALGDAAGAGNLSSGSTFESLLGPGAADCTIADAGRSVTCDFGQLRGNGDGRLVTVVVNPGTATTVSVGGFAQINETQGTTNPDTFWASGSTTVFAGGGDKFGMVLTGGGTFQGSTAFGANGQLASVLVARPAAADDVLGILESVDPGAHDIDCAAAGKSCFGQTIQLVINFGEPLDPDAVVSITFADKSVKPAGLLHELDDGTIVDIVNSKANGCASPSATNCIVSSKATRDGYTLAVRIPVNGFVKTY